MFVKSTNPAIQDFINQVLEATTDKADIYFNPETLDRQLNCTPITRQEKLEERCFEEILILLLKTL